MYTLPSVGSIHAIYPTVAGHMAYQLAEADLDFLWMGGLTPTSLAISRAEGGGGGGGGGPTYLFFHRF